MWISVSLAYYCVLVSLPSVGECFCHIPIILVKKRPLKIVFYLQSLRGLKHNVALCLWNAEK